jgi:hypothetical protein
MNPMSLRIVYIFTFIILACIAVPSKKQHNNVVSHIVENFYFCKLMIKSHVIFMLILSSIEFRCQAFTDQRSVIEI